MRSMAVPAPIAWDAPTVTRRAAEGEAEFARLFEEYSAPIYNYVLRMVGDPDRAADITQDTFIKAYRKLHTVTEATSTRSWLYRIATNTAIDDMRRRRMVTPMGDDAASYANRPDQRPGPEAQVLATTLDERVQRALDEPPPQPPPVPPAQRPRGHERAADRRRDGPLLRRGADAPLPRPRRDAARAQRGRVRAMTMDRHEPFEELISASLTGDLTAAERQRLDAHLDSCGHCRATLAAFADQRRIMAGLRHVAPPRDLGARVRTGIEYGRRIASVPWWRRPAVMFAGVGGSLAAVAGALLALVLLNGSPQEPIVGASITPTPTPAVVEPHPERRRTDPAPDRHADSRGLAGRGACLPRSGQRPPPTPSRSPPSPTCSCR